MPRSIDCDYCGDDIEPGTGTMLVRVNGQTVHYCSAKCEKNADLGREARDLEWTDAGGGLGRDDADAAVEASPAVDDAAQPEPDAGSESDAKTGVDDGDAEADDDTDAGADDDTDADSTADGQDATEEEEAEA